jgi:glycosyltransferase involved in cell wall biosynthesis
MRLEVDWGGGWLKILWSTPTYAPFIGGARVFVEQMARRLVTDGHHVIVLTTNARQASDFWQCPDSEEQILPHAEVLDGVTVQRLSLAYPRPMPYLFGALRRAGLWMHLLRCPAMLAAPLQRYLARWMPPLPGLRQALERWAPQMDLIQSDDASWDGLLIASAEAARRCGKPLLVRPLMHLGDRRVRAHYQMAHQVPVYQGAAAVLALSQREAAALVALGVPPQRVHRMRMGVELRLPVSPQGLDPGAFRREYRLEGPIVAFVGANTYDKGTFTLIHSVVQLNLEGLAVNLVCVGPQSQGLRDYLQQQPQEVQAVVRDHIHILGVVDEVTKHRLLAACDLLALPSQVDTFGIVFLEAWLHGKPVIGANAGGIPEVVEHGRNGLLVPFGGREALAAAIRHLLQEPQFATRLGDAGRSAVQHYTWDATYQTLLGIYHRLLADPA